MMPKWGIFFWLHVPVYKSVRISEIEEYEVLEKSVIGYFKGLFIKIVCTVLFLWHYMKRQEHYLFWQFMQNSKARKYVKGVQFSIIKMAYKRVRK